MSDKLLPCPFCGKLPTIGGYKSRQQQMAWVMCSNKACVIYEKPIIERSTHQEVVTAWNTRAPSDAPQGGDHER